MKRKFVIIIMALMCMFVQSSVFGIGFHPEPRHHKSNKSGNTERTTVADPAEAYYDIKYLKFDLHMSDTSLVVSGNVSTKAMVTVFSMSSYVFELDTTYTIDSAKINGIIAPVFTTGASIRTIVLRTALDSGAMFTAQVYYHGFPPPGGGFFNGLTHSVSTGGTQMVYSLSDPYVAINWWPTKQCLTDKIDSVDMYITVPSGVYDGSNGKLVNIDSTSTPGFWQHHWKTNYPIEYYLISVAIARYAVFENYLHFAGSTDSMLIQDFFMDTATFDPLYKANFDSVGMIINYFSSLFGRYPFWKEKYGVCYTTLPGGMEHQTMTTIGVPNTYIIAHELCHQWFGDNAAFSNWHDVWLSEGFATYAQTLFYDHFNSPAAALAERKTLMNSATSLICGCTYVHDTTSASTLFFQPTVYNKGQAIVHMLRYVAPSDSVFFLGLQTYQSLYGGSEANTEQFKTVMEGVYGYPLDTFFNQWVYGSGFPKYSLLWNQVGSTVYIQLTQTASCAGTTPLFATPVEVELQSTTGDTILKLYNDQPVQLYSINWSQTMDTFAFNPDVWTICKFTSASHYHDTTLGVTSPIVSGNIHIFPNPAKDNWTVSQLPAGLQLILTDIGGKSLWEGISNRGNTVIPAQSLPAGDYILKIGNDEMTYKLTHW